MGETEYSEAPQEEVSSTIFLAEYTHEYIRLI